jgi:hypothetical protein
MNHPIDPDRLTSMMNDAVAPVRPRADALSAIRKGVRRRRKMHRVAVAAAAVVVIAGGAVAYGAAQSPASPPPATRSTQRPTPTQSLTPTQSPAPAPSRVSSIPVSATIVPAGNAHTTTSFRLVVAMKTGGTQTVPFTASSAEVIPPKGPQVVGIVDAGPDRQAAIFVLIDSGASTQFWTIFTMDGGHMVQATTSGQPLRLAVGGSVMENGGFSCDDPGTDVATYGYGATSTAATAWTVDRDTYRWAGVSLVRVSHAQTTLHVPASSQKLAKYAGVRCGHLPSYAGR